VLIGPFVRDTLSPIQRRLYPALFRVMFAGPWGVSAWMRFWRGLYPTAHPADFDDYAARLRANLREPGRLAALRSMMASVSGPDLEARLDRVTAPSLVVMGTADHDFPDPAAEAELIAGRLGGEVAMIEGAGHYPHVEFPAETGPAIVRFAREALAMEVSRAG
jgi:pimeloyl-ACP methyl ester carboxylesterase